MTDDNKPKIDRRSLLLGAGVGIGGAAVVAVGGAAIKSATSSIATPKAVGKGKPAKIATSFKDSRPAQAEETKAPAGAPNVVVIILDDVGFADLGCYGGELITPSLDALAGAGLRYTNFRTTAMCSCTRAALLTGLNHHSAGMGWLADIDSGYPGYRGDLTRQNATLAEVLVEAGWSTFLLGKWHVNNAEHGGANGPYHNWPTHRGFERAYWYQGHSSDHFHPGALYEGTARVETGGDNYYLSDDLAERAVTYLHTQKAMAPDKPFYMQLAFGAAHSPLQAKAADRDLYKGRFEAGWDEIRKHRLERQKSLGLMPAETPLPPLSPGAKPWAELTADQKRLYARYMEVFGGMVTGADRAIGRVMAELEAMGLRENTLVVVFSDNGASAEGTETGTPNVFGPAFGRPASEAEALALYDTMGEDGTFPHYPIGWTNASNTPYRLYKQYTSLGGVADPLIVAWPKGVADKGGVRKQFVHVVDLYPTVLDACGVQRPELYRGEAQKPLEGASVAKTFASPQVATRTEQYYELGGFRAFEEGSWRLVAQHQRGKAFEDDHWGLYDTAHDPNELRDVSADHPEVAARLRSKWDKAAAAYDVLPLDDRPLLLKLVQQRGAKLRKRWDIRPPIDPISTDVSPIVCGLSHSIEVELSRPKGDEDGVLIAHGSLPAGYVLYIDKGRLIYETSLLPWSEVIAAPDRLPRGPVKVKYQQSMTSRPFEGRGALYVNGRKVAEHKFERVLFAPGYDGFCVGSDQGNRVSRAYEGPNPFQGKISRVLIDVDTAAMSPLEIMRFMKAMSIKV
ncbi:MAG: arylsulfatase [Alphaproteobacteria bacterium]|nr:arylsulfatase [Alphaproteobacteria bacterium]